MIQHPKLEELARRDPRFAPEAYEFIFDALSHTLKRLGRTPPEGDEPWEGEHVTVAELLDGARDLALREYGLLARAVLRAWGVNSTGDLGEVVFNLVDAGLMDPSAADDRGGFQNVFDLDRALLDGYQIAAGDDAEGTP
jgi:uncharacterized repeat protein (TIGR04138 family)